MSARFALLGFVLGMAVLLPLMLTFDAARPWIALGGIACAGLMYAWGRHTRLRRQRGALRS